MLVVRLHLQVTQRKTLIRLFDVIGSGLHSTNMILLNVLYLKKNKNCEEALNESNRSLRNLKSIYFYLAKWRYRKGSGFILFGVLRDVRLVKKFLIV